MTVEEKEEKEEVLLRRRAPEAWAKAAAEQL